MFVGCLNTGVSVQCIHNGWVTPLLADRHILYLFPDICRDFHFGIRCERDVLPFVQQSKCIEFVPVHFTLWQKTHISLHGAAMAEEHAHLL